MFEKRSELRQGSPPSREPPHRFDPNRYLHENQTTASVAEAARTSLPNATVELVDDAGHLLMLERPAVFREKLRGWLND